MHTLVVGAGVVGLATAYQLLKRGDDVTLIERAHVGSGASRGNAGQICPELATPVAKTSLIASAVTQAYRQDSALHVDPLSIPTYAQFLAQVAWNALPKRYARNQAALQQIGPKAADAFNELAQELSVEPNEAGYLHLFDDRRSAVSGREALIGRLAKSPREHFVDSVLPADQIDPSIKSGSFGFLYRGSSFIDPNQLVDSLAEACISLGAEIHEGAYTVRLSEGSDHAVAHTNKGDFHADRLAICAGVDSQRLAAYLDVRLPLKAGKGYSFTFHPDPAPQYVIKFESAHAALLPMPDGTRIAGTMEFDNDYARFNYNRINQIVKAVEPYFDTDDLARRTQEWVGARPVTPDGLPIIGLLPRTERTFIHAGHNMLGLMLAPYTAEVLASLMSTSAGSGVTPVSVGRYRR